ncbi:acetyl-CoA hydrolase/transferase C-terminal domain-containing protein [Draconibacterium sp. IB214405]|uniref:acetyl-CoA hydrolase/transferase family protein n=1 Tax=Draconibacterium sp. IB214405 TaxID=3097352 RepID=UPI002A0B7D50|nr:acetyl-CoA hydrolase/transferase C-terminal domain-containing protein [Draconibacterium sp. IB214405]MDX8339493.1 acetyl-CoA hydrolase/transferase C-terminal domain-containing protein [Draconibacterium sp. IB214405]
MKNIKYVSPEEAVKVIKTGDRVHLSSVAVTPHTLIKPMVERGRNKEFHSVTIQHIHVEGEVEYANPEFEGIFISEQFFVGGNLRKQTQSGYADYIPIFLSETQRLMRRGYLKVNVAMIMVSTPDKHGYVSLGTSVDATRAAIENADTVIAAVNPNVPRAWGDAMMHIDEIDIFVEDDIPLYVHDPAPLSEMDIKIGKNVAELVDDGACLQMGIGGIPNAVLAQLGNHKDLGVHTEMFADGILPLVEKGVVTGKKKKTDPGKMVASFLMGSQALYDFVDDNPRVAMMDVAHTNHVANIRKNDKVTAINSALAIDLTGQVCADSIGITHYSGVGGQIDFIRGAGHSKKGKPIIALPSVTNKGISKISPTLISGSGVVTTRANMHWVVTEYGAVNLYGKTLQERAKLLISIAHPDHQESLDKASFERFGPHYHYVRGE